MEAQLPLQHDARASRRTAHCGSRYGFNTHVGDHNLTNIRWDAECGRELELRRDLPGLTQKELSARVGVTERSYRNWKSGSSAPSAVNRADLVESLGGARRRSLV